MVKTFILKQLLTFPFVLSIDGHPKLNGARVAEGLIIAAIAGLVSGYIAVAELKVEFNSLKCDVAYLRTQYEKLDTRIYDIQKKENER